MKDSNSISLYLNTATKVFKIGAKCADIIKTYNLGNPKQTLERLNLGIKMLCDDFSFSLKDINNYYCLLGPGSNTGIRLGLTIPKTVYAFNHNIKLYGIKTMDLMTIESKYAALSDRNGNLFFASKDNSGITTYKRIDKKDIDAINVDSPILVEDRDFMAINELEKNHQLIKKDILSLMIKYEDKFKDYSQDNENYLPEYLLQL